MIRPSASSTPSWVTTWVPSLTTMRCASARCARFGRGRSIYHGRCGPHSRREIDLRVPLLTAALRTFAEDPECEIADVPGIAPRITTPHFSLHLAPSRTQSVTTRVRTTAADLDTTIAEVRARLREVGFHGNVWHVGPSARPEGLAAMLRARGFVPATRPPYEPVLTSMVLVEPPAAASDPAIEVRTVSNLDEYVQALRVAMVAFNESEEDAAGWMAAAPSLWASQDGKDCFTHIAFLDGKPVGFGFAAGAPSGIFLLGGSGVLPEARGRGVYRAMLAARWLHAQQMGGIGVAIRLARCRAPGSSTAAGSRSSVSSRCSTT